MARLTLVVLNLADVAVENRKLISTDLERPVLATMRDLVTDTGIVNHASPKLVTVTEFGDIVFRVRTMSRYLRRGLLWQSVDAELSEQDRWALEEALESERP